MKFIRKTAAGKMEYWDSEKKKVVQLSADQQAMLPVLSKPAIDLGTTTADTSQAVTAAVEELQELADGEATAEELADDKQEKESMFTFMTINELREYAKNKDIRIPSEIRNKTELIQFIEGEVAGDE